VWVTWVSVLRPTQQPKEMSDAKKNSAEWALFFCYLQG